MLTTARAPRVDISRLAFRAPLLAPASLDIPADHLPEIPATWRPVYGREIATATQRFRAFARTDGVSVCLHSTIGLHLELDGRLIALVNLGGHRVAVHAGTGRFEARWTCAGRTHRLTAEPMQLGGFMDLVLNLNWA